MSGNELKMKMIYVLISLKIYDKAHSSISGGELIMLLCWKWCKFLINIL